MPDDWTLDFLTISRHDEPPPDAVVIRALAGADFGAVEYAPTPAPEVGAPPADRRRIGTYSLREPHSFASGRITITHHSQPVLAGMGETALNTISRGLGPDDVRTLREGQLAMDLRVTVTEAINGVFLTWATRVLLVLLGLTEGVAIDPATQRGFGRVELARLASATGPLDHVAIHAEPWGSDAYWLHTHGVQKFARPELEMVAVPRAYEPEGRALLADLGENLARGARLAAGQEVDLEELGTLVAVATPTDVDHQAMFGRLRLVDAPEPGEQLGQTATRLLERWVLADAAGRVQRGDLPGAFDVLDRALAADPDDCAALTLKARLQLRVGQLLEALQLGELMELRVAADWRGPLIAGHALAALGRVQEALRAYTRAIERNPDDGEAFAARAGVFERLGHARQAAADRSRAAYLSA